jgi:hypothetical protein
VVGGLVGEMLGMYAVNRNWGAIFTVVAGLIFSVVYYIGAWANSGQTLGDTLLGLKVVRTQGTPLSMGGAIMRYIGYLLSAAALSLGFLWIAFDKNRQGWHDKIARTVVVPAHQEFADEHNVRFVPADNSAGPIWIGAWLVLALLAPGALTAGIWSLGPFVDMALKSLRGG